MVSRNHIDAILRGDFKDEESNVKRQSVAYTKSGTTNFDTHPSFSILTSPRNLVSHFRDSAVANHKHQQPHPTYPNQPPPSSSPNESVMVDVDNISKACSILPPTALVNK